MSLLLLVTALPTSVFAVETDTSDCDELIELTCSVFPEYAEKFRNPESSSSTYSYGTEQRTLIVNETRVASDTQSITYTEYSDGLILLSELEFTGDSSFVSKDETSTSTDMTIDIEAACVYNGYSRGYFHLNGVKYSLITSGYDRIINTGTKDYGNYCTLAENFRTNLNESADSYAEIGYHLAFKLNSTGSVTVDSILILFVGENTAVLNHVDYNDYY